MDHWHTAPENVYAGMSDCFVARGIKKSGETPQFFLLPRRGLLWYDRQSGRIILWHWGGGLSGQMKDGSRSASKTSAILHKGREEK